MNDDRRHEERLGELARDYHAPPPAPRDRMWEGIETARRGAPAVMRPPWWRAPRLLWPAAAAAVLILGIAIGRWTLPREEGQQLAGRADGEAAVADSAVLPDVIASADLAAGGLAGGDGSTVPDRSRAYRLAAVPLVDRSVLLLTRYRTGADPGGDDVGFTERARRLLQETRLLQSSPASEDPELARLLDDLELTLARVVQAADTQIEEERAMVEEGIQEQGLIGRLRRWAPPAGARMSL
jgi:hypothetical protein